MSKKKKRQAKRKEKAMRREAQAAAAKVENKKEVIEIKTEEVKENIKTSKETNKETTKEKNKNTNTNKAGFFIPLFFFLAVSLLCAAVWFFSTWSRMTVSELLYHLTMPMEGTSSDMIVKGIVNSFGPALILTPLFIMLLKKTSHKHLRRLLKALPACVLAFTLIMTSMKLDLLAYLRNRTSDSTFAEENYADPDSVEITFPEEKRNLIYIYLESMEVTFTDEENGGAFEEDIIPELTALAQENEDFSGSDTALNGGYSMPNTDWTVAAMFAETSGLPLETSLDQNEMSTQESFFDGVTCLGDILEHNGYHNTLLIGSNAVFGGRKLYFDTHGSYDIEDYTYAKQQGWIDEDYRVWWGYEDAKLFTFAKNELTRLSESDEPFNLTILTVDTHFEDGYVCDDCEDEYDVQYANVYACSSKRVAEFIDWCKEQDFYENTTIVLSGDHPTMDADFCEDVDEDYVRKTYTCYINADAENEAPDRRRDFTTFDAFPTTLAALGVEIEGDRLGLGTNLFSDTETLTEQYGIGYMASELEKKSDFLMSLAKTSKDGEETTYDPHSDLEFSFDDDFTTMEVFIDAVYSLGEGYTGVRIEYYSGDGETQMERAWMDDEGDWHITADVTGMNPDDMHASIYAEGVSGTDFEIYHGDGNLVMKSNSLDGYFGVLNTIAHSDRYAVFVLFDEDEYDNLLPSEVELFHTFGFEISEEDGIYMAVRYNDEVTESTESLTGDVNGVTYEISNHSLIINGTEYAKEAAGIQFVIYNTEENLCADSVTYDIRYLKAYRDGTVRQTSTTD